MRIAILGTGRVAQTLAAGLLRAGHDVVFGSRDPESRTELPAPVLASADAVVGADVVLNAVPGVDTVPLLASIGPDNLDGAVLWDIANATNPDFSLAIPDDSLGRRIQEALPGAKVVKAGNNVAAVGVTPANSSNYNCGSPFFANTSGGFSGDALTDEGDSACQIEGGLANRRATALALLAAGGVFGVAAIIISSTGQANPTRTVGVVNRIFPPGRSSSGRGPTCRRPQPLSRRHSR